MKIPRLILPLFVCIWPAAFSAVSAATLQITTLVSPSGSNGVALNGPSGIAVDNSGNLYIADTNNQRIDKLTASGSLSVFAGQSGQNGSTDGTGTAARFNFPTGVAIDGSGNLYVADRMNYTIRKITTNGVVSTFAGTNGQYGLVDGAPGVAKFNEPSALAIDSSGTVYVADFGNRAVRKITPTGVTSTLATIPTPGGYIRGITVDSKGYVYVTDALPDAFVGTVTGGQVIYAITPSGTVAVIAGSLGTAGLTDGIGQAARFSSPMGITIDYSNNLWVADSGNNAIREISSVAASVVTQAGGSGPGTADGSGSTAQFRLPSAIATDGNGTYYIADTGNNSIRKGVEQGSHIAAATSGRLLNISSLGQINSSLSLTAGFVVGSGTEVVLVRAVGAQLKAFGVPNPVQSLELDLYNAAGTLVQSSTQLSGVTSVEAGTGAFPITNDAGDAEFSVSLAPGSYSAVAKATSNSSGAVLVEVYEISSTTSTQ